MQKPTQDIILGGLLFATLAILLANHFVIRTVTFDYHNASTISTADDRAEGGNSKASAELIDGAFIMKYDIDAVSHSTPYAALQIRRQDESDNGLYDDLSWAEFFEIELRSSKPEGEHFLFALRNFEPNISKAEDPRSFKYNESLVNATNKMSIVKVKRDEFLVPPWWKTLYNVKSDDAYPSFKRIEWLEFTTLGDVGSGELEVKSVKCAGHWINTAKLNQALLWLWMGGTLLASLCRMLGLKRKLNEKTASALELLHHNNLLISESATYHELARRDPLTGLLNRYGLEGKFEELTAATGGFSYTIILFDLDDFKRINDKHGHCYGDRVLFDIARIVNSKVSKSDIVARWGGDEFLIVLFDQTLIQAKEFTEEIRRAVLASDLMYTCSFGISKSEANVTFEEILRNADTALYQSKEGGRDTANIFRTRKEDGEFDPEEAKDDPVPVVLLPNLEPPIEGFTIHE